MSAAAARVTAAMKATETTRPAAAVPAATAGAQFVRPKWAPQHSKGRHRDQYQKKMSSLTPRLSHVDLKTMSRIPSRTLWPEIAVACNPTGIMIEKWRAPSDTRAPYPPNLPIGEHTTWDLKSEAEVALAHMVKIVNEVECVPTEALTPLGNWDNWWKRRNQSQDLDAVWDNDKDGTIDHKLRQQHQELVDWRIEGVRADACTAQVRVSINAGWARMP